MPILHAVFAASSAAVIGLVLKERASRARTGRAAFLHGFFGVVVLDPSHSFSCARNAIGISGWGMNVRAKDEVSED